MRDAIEPRRKAQQRHHHKRNLVIPLRAHLILDLLLHLDRSGLARRCRHLAAIAVGCVQVLVRGSLFGPAVLEACVVGHCGEWVMVCLLGRGVVSMAEVM
jgi:hypothetical protein